MGTLSSVLIKIILCDVFFYYLQTSFTILYLLSNVCVSLCVWWHISHNNYLVFNMCEFAECERRAFVCMCMLRAVYL